MENEERKHTHFLRSSKPYKSLYPSSQQVTALRREMTELMKSVKELQATYDLLLAEMPADWAAREANMERMLEQLSGVATDIKGDLRQLQTKYANLADEKDRRDSQ